MPIPTLILFLSEMNIGKNNILMYLNILKKWLNLSSKSIDNQTFGKSNQSNRDKWIIEKLTQIPANCRILDAGAGEQPYRKFCQHLNYISQDFNLYQPQNSNIGLQMSSWKYQNIDIQSDITQIPQPDDSFDAILCSEVLEHIPDPVLALKELARLLKKGGNLILTAPFCSITHFAPYHYSTGFNVYFYEEHLNKLGFNILEISPNGNYFEYLAQELHRLNYVVQKYTNTSLYTDNQVLITKIIQLLSQINQKENNSSELLCFGYHVYAEKL